MSPIWFPGIVHSNDLPTRKPVRWKRPAWVALAAVVLGVVALRLEGRLWICSCGRIDLWAGNVWSSDNSQHFADPYSLSHILHGMMFFWILLGLRRIDVQWRFSIAVAAEVLWEIVENSTYVIERYRTATVSLGYTGDTIVNSLGDIAACGVGFAVARYLGVRRSIYGFVLIELLLLIWIRDSLVLNIIMLIRPIDAILQWQMG